jgi:hypothetical protein
MQHLQHASTGEDSLSDDARSSCHLSLTRSAVRLGQLPGNQPFRQVSGREARPPAGSVGSVMRRMVVMVVMPMVRRVRQ